MYDNLNTANITRAASIWVFRSRINMMRLCNTVLKYGTFGSVIRFIGFYKHLSTVRAGAVGTAATTARTSAEF
jgi:hypothetical protein